MDMAREKIFFVSITVAALLSLTTADSQAMFAHPTLAPVDRLISNVTAYISEHPEDPDGYYTLGRLHSLAYSHQANRLRVPKRNDMKLPEFVGYETPPKARNLR